MKVGTTELVKFRHLKRALGLPHFGAVGILESLWMFAAKNSPLGDIGKHSNEDIACMVEWDESPDELIDHLVKYRWLDAHPEHRLVIHDWSEHAPNWLKGNLASRGKQFADTLSQPAKHGAKRSAKHRTHSTSQAATKSSQSNSNLSPPIDTATVAPLQIQRGTDAERGEMAEILRKIGLAAVEPAAKEAITRDYTADQVRALTDELSRRPNLGPGALVFRIRNTPPDAPLNEGWPEPTVKPAAAGRGDDQYRKQSSEQLATIEAASAKAKAESERIQQLELALADDIDNTNAEDLVRLLPQVLQREKCAATIREKSWRDLPAIVRRKLVTSFANGCEL
ncbi:MAG: hypothetical protein HQ518_25650 [Rhodopirellula sp.]|nr:hypothetical protein [Rhodopirellula sp.]